MTTSPFTLTTIHGLAEYHQYMHRRSVQIVRTNTTVSEHARDMAVMGLLDEAHEWYREMREQYPRGHGRQCYYCGQRPVYGQRGVSDVFCRPCLERYEESQYTRFRYLP